MMTPEMKLAQDELRALDAQIAQAKSNLRVLKSIGGGDVLSLQRNLDEALNKRDQVMRAIQAEADRPEEA